MTKVPVESKKTLPAKWQGVDPWQNFRTEVDRLFDRFSTGFGLPMFGRMFDFEPAWSAPVGLTAAMPAVDITEDEKAYRITAEMPGMEEKDVAVTLTGDTLMIKGEKHAEKEEKERNYFVSERTYGAFQRSFTLPEGVNRDAIAAEVAKGVLTVMLPKTALAQKEQKKIEVKHAA